MQPNQCDILVLKPTKTFLSFLESQLEMEEDYLDLIDLPDLEILQTDCTAYTIPKQISDEETLHEIESRYPFMFRHEISRWLGEDARNDIETSFLDFLCCFKFELHSQIMLLESSLDSGQQMLRIRPRSVLLKWMKSSLERQTEADISDVLDKVEINHIEENATVVVKNFETLGDIKVFLKDNYPILFASEMNRLHQKEEQWPKMESYETFTKYFAVEIHSQLNHLVH